MFFHIAILKFNILIYFPAPCTKCNYKDEEYEEKYHSIPFLVS